jgi:hypothetical protein
MLKSGLYPASSGLNIRLVDNATIFIVLLANVGCKAEHLQGWRWGMLPIIPRLCNVCLCT